MPFVCHPGSHQRGWWSDRGLLTPRPGPTLPFQHPRTKSWGSLHCSVHTLPKPSPCCRNPGPSSRSREHLPAPPPRLRPQDSTAQQQAHRNLPSVISLRRWLPVVVICLNSEPPATQHIVSSVQVTEHKAKEALKARTPPVVWPLKERARAFHATHAPLRGSRGQMSTGPPLFLVMTTPSRGLVPPTM